MSARYIRSQQGIAATLACVILGPVFMLGPLVIGLAVVLGTQFSLLSLVLFPALAAASAFIIYHMFQNYHWVELEGDVIRGRRFWTRQFIERRLHEVSEVVPLGAMAKTVHTEIADQLLGSVRGYEIRFRGGGQRIVLVRHDMGNVDEFITELNSQLRLRSGGERQSAMPS